MGNSTLNDPKGAIYMEVAFDAKRDRWVCRDKRDHSQIVFNAATEEDAYVWYNYVKYYPFGPPRKGQEEDSDED